MEKRLSEALDVCVTGIYTPLQDVPVMVLEITCINLMDPWSDRVHEDYIVMVMN